jgi:hypothetical protein
MICGNGLFHHPRSLTPGAAGWGAGDGRLFHVVGALQRQMGKQCTPATVKVLSVCIIFAPMLYVVSCELFELPFKNSDLSLILKVGTAVANIKTKAPFSSPVAGSGKPFLPSLTLPATGTFFAIKL